MATRVANPPANSPYKGPVIQVDTGAGYTVDVNDQTVAVVAGGAASTVTLPQNPQADVTTILFVAEAAFNLTAGALGGLAVDPMPIVAGDNFYMTRTKANTWVKDNDAGGGSGLTPLVRTKFIDGDTTTPAADANGSIALPFASVTAYFAALGNNATVSDANQTAEALISPATGAAYTENPTVPAYRNIVLRLLSAGLSGASTFTMTGNLTWTNTAAAGGVNVGSIGSLGLANLAISGNIVYTDDAGAPVSELLLSNDQSTATAVGGNITAGGTKLTAIVLLNTTVTGNIVSTANGTGAIVTAIQGGCLGAITAKSGTFTDCTFSGGGANVFTFNAGSTPSFIGCTFSGGSIAAGAGSVVTMDAVSFASFKANGMALSSGAIKLLTGNPLSRTKYIDGGAFATNTPTGDVQSPFISVSAYLAALGPNASVADANQLAVGLISPSTVAAYTENPAIPAYRNVELKGVAYGPPGGVSDLKITGNVTWANKVAGGGVNAGSISSLCLHDIDLTGTVTITDDGTVASRVRISNGSDPGSAAIGGAFTCSGCTLLASIDYSNTVQTGNLVSVASAAGAAVNANGATFSGTVTCKSLVANRSSFAGNITINSGAAMTFTQCTFSGTPALTAGATGTISMDGPSWRSFQEAGGTIVSGIVTVVGGYLAGDVAGANLTNADVTVTINGTGATAGFTGGGNHYTLPAATLGAAHVLTLGVGGGEKKGDTILVTRNDATANTYTINDDAATTLSVMGIFKINSALFTFNGTHFVNAMPGVN